MFNIPSLPDLFGQIACRPQVLWSRKSESDQVGESNIHNSVIQPVLACFLEILGKQVPDAIWERLPAHHAQHHPLPRPPIARKKTRTIPPRHIMIRIYPDYMMRTVYRDPVNPPGGALPARCRRSQQRPVMAVSYPSCAWSSPRACRGA